MKKRIIISIILIGIIALTIILLKLWIMNNKKKEQVAVLMYHNVVLDENYENQADTVTVSMLENHLKFLKDNNFKTLTLDEFYCWKKGQCKYNDNSIVLTFDDGFYSFHYLVEPLLKKYDMHAVNFLIGKTVGDKTNEYDPNKYGTIGKDLLNNHSDNVDYQSHSFNLHILNDKPIIYELNENELQKDISSMNDIYEFKYISYPFNTDTDLMIKLLKKNDYKLAFRGESEKATKDVNDYQIPRIGTYNNLEFLEKVVNTDYYNNRYGNGLIRKIFINIERKIKRRVFK